MKHNKKYERIRIYINIIYYVIKSDAGIHNYYCAYKKIIRSDIRCDKLILFLKSI